MYFFAGKCRFQAVANKILWHGGFNREPGLVSRGSQLDLQRSSVWINLHYNRAAILDVDGKRFRQTFWPRCGSNTMRPRFFTGQGTLTKYSPGLSPDSGGSEKRPSFHASRPRYWRRFPALGEN